MSHIGEFDLIRRISATVNVPQGVTGIGDDCAIIPQKQGLDTLVTTDLLIEGRHFLLSDVSPFDLGWKSAAVNISDIAAMGGRPVGAFLSIALPAGTGAEWVDGFIRGFNELCGRYGVALLGGDTSASDDKLFINVTIIGECAHGQAVMRSGARAGDIVYVTGPLGDSAAGLKLILERSAMPDCPEEEATEAFLISRHYLPEPRVEMGMALAALPGVHSMMDISDGIASDLKHILEESPGSGQPDPDRHGRPDRPSPLAAEVDVRSLPLSEELKAVCAKHGWDPVELAVSGGEDYELLFTAEPAVAVPQGCVAIGRIVAGDGGIKWIGSDREYQGFTHF